ncbi:tandem-95 repeat protein, partial [Rhodobacteraceae bacterium NNCM2]|nr:tandem-95 repeat protein [Coraliihabitans acroporae]
FLSEPSQRFQMQGLLVEQDASNWIRFDVYSDGNVLRIFSAVTVNGSSSVRINATIAEGAAEYMRVERDGDTWTLLISADGESWAAAGSFDHALEVSEAGVFAGNTSSAAGFTAEVDYFEVDSDPLAIEDGPNAAPETGDDIVATNQDAAIVISVADLLANDSDPEGAELTLVGFTDPSNGTLVDNGDGTLTYTPAAGYAGLDQVAYTVTDGVLESTGSLTLRVVAPGNASPVANPDNVSVNEDGSLLIAPLTNDTDGDGDTLSLVSVGAPLHGSLVDNGDGTLTYVPDANFHGTDTVEYVVEDGQGGLASGSITITVDAVNDAPVAVDDSLTVQADTTRLIDVAADLLANDTDIDGDALSLADLGTPAHGTVIANGDGTYSYIPETGFRGVDTITYTVTDGEASSTGTLSLAVAPQGGFFSDDFSGATPYADWTLEGPSASAETYVVSPDGYLELTVPDGGNFDLWNNSKDAARYMQSAEDTDFTVEVKFLTMPTERTQMQGILVEQDEDDWIRFDVLHNGSNLQIFAAVTVDGVSQKIIASNLNITSVPYLRVSRTDDTWTFEFSTDGNDWIEAGEFDHALEVTSIGPFSASASGASSHTAVVDYFENAADPVTDDATIPQPPTIGEDSFSVRAGTPLIIDIAADLMANDFDNNGDPISFVSATSTGAGTIVDNGDGTLTFTPAEDFLGTDEFSYTLSDGTSTSTGTVSVVVAQPAASDDFAGGPLDDVWYFDGIAGFARIATNDTDGFVEIRSPAGVQVSASDNLTTPRLLQSVVDEDFQITAGFLTEPSQKYQEHGFLVIQDELNWLRFDLAYTGSSLKLIVGVIENGSTSYPLFKTVGSGSVKDMRITRDGDDWLFEYSSDGVTWKTAYELTHEMFVTELGLFAGSTSFDSDVPGYSAHVDYFENTATPIVDEDANLIPTNVSPTAVDDSLTTSRGTPLIIDIATDILGNDEDANGDALSFAITDQPSNGTLVDNGDGTLTFTPDDGFGGPDSFTYTVSDGEFTGRATVSINVADPIDVWYGDEQSFGNLGETQTWINILGNLSDEEITSLSYTLNGGESRSLVIGGDGRRLSQEGDFNIEIAYDELDGSEVDDVIVITGVRSDGTTITQQVTVDYVEGNSWDKNFTIDWSEVTDPQSVVQIVDGNWQFDENGATPLVQGYDRLLTIGDAGWDNYEVDLSITMNDLQSASPIHGGLFALGFLWSGHTDNPVAGYDPHAGWENSAGFYFWGEDELSIDRYEGWGGARGNAYTFEEGSTYNFTVRVEQTGIFDRIYKLKIWEEGEVEPDDWLVERVDTFDEPITGSFVLNSHFESVTFGDITVTEIEGSDIIAGRDSSDVILAVDPTDANPGAGEVDVLIGGAGADTFVLGDASGSFYDDGDDQTMGEQDFAMIWDFEAGVDTLHLYGSEEMYRLDAAPSTVYDGDALYLVNGNGQDELVAVFNGSMTSLDDAEYFLV